MVFFDKLSGPVVLKEDSNAKKAYEQLSNLSKIVANDKKEKIERDKRLLYYGIKGEEALMFELKNSHIPMYIMHDVFFEDNDLKTQIDYIVITRKLVLIIECKNLYGNISVDSQGNFTRTIPYGQHYYKEGIYSPITQNQRHLDMIKEKRRNSKGILGKVLFDHFFNDNYKSIVVIANTKSIVDTRYAPNEIKSQIVKVDRLISYIKKLNNESSNETMSDKQMKEIADFFLNNSVPNTTEFISKYQVDVNNLHDALPKGINISTDISKTMTSKKSTSINTDVDVLSKDNICVNEMIFSEENADLNNEKVVNSATDEFVEDDLNKGTDDGNIQELPVYKALKDYRYKQSKIEKIKAYYIFNNMQLEEIIKVKPKTIEELKTVKGFGNIKCSKYGNDILRVLEEHLKL